MIIVSQDKKEIINFNNVCNVYIDRAAESEEGRLPIELESINDSFITIGFYNSVDRAKEVLQEIINTYEKTQYYKYGWEKDKEYICEIADNLFKYEMPEK